MHGITNPESIAGSFPSRDALRTALFSIVRGQRHQRGWMAIRRRPVAKKRTESDRISGDLVIVLVWLPSGANNPDPPGIFRERSTRYGELHYGFVCQRRTVKSQRSSVLVAPLGAEPQVIAISAQLLQSSGQELTGVDVLYTNPNLEPVKSSLTDLQAMFCDQAHWPILYESPIPTDDLLLHEDLLLFEVILFQDLKRWMQQGYRIFLQLAGGRKTTAMIGMAVAQMILRPSDQVLYLSSDEALRTSRRHILEPSDKAQLHRIPLNTNVVSTEWELAMGADTPSQARQKMQAANQERVKRFLDSLTPTEKKIAGAIAYSTSQTRELAAQLHLSEATISNALTRIYSKLETA